MKDHCRESVGFSFRAPLCGFCGRRFCLCEVFCDQCYNSAFLLFSPSSVMILHFSFSFLFPCSFSSLRTKQLLVFELSVLCVCFFHCVIATDRVLLQNYNPFRVVLQAVDSLNIKHELRSKNRAILYHAEISKRYFSVCPWKIVFYFLHELKQKSRRSGVTGRH